MNILNFKALSTAALISFSSLTFAADSSDNFSAGSKHSALASSHVVVGSAQVTASAVAIPLIAIGSVGVVSAAAGSAILDSPRAYQPLEVTEITITQDPSPAQAMQ